MRFVDPLEYFQGTLAITVPHMDDCVLGCGGMIAKLPNKERIHLIYATDGRRSPAPVLPRRSAVINDLGRIRMQEARAALHFLGVPIENIHFLNLPDSRLKNHKKALLRLLGERIEHIDPDHLLTPFRYDRHPDHLALNHVVNIIFQQAGQQMKLTEYFVYYRWRLLSTSDVRKYIRPECLFQVDIKDASSQKRAALDYFQSQTTRFYSWQTRPNLTPQFLDDVSRTPEFFLPFDPAITGARVFTHQTTWIRVAHRLEPYLKSRKDEIVALMRGEAWKNGSKS